MNSTLQSSQFTLISHFSGNRHSGLSPCEMLNVKSMTNAKCKMIIRPIRENYMPSPSLPATRKIASTARSYINTSEGGRG